MARALKPKTKQEKEVVRLSATIPQIDIWSEDNIGTDVGEFFVNVEDGLSYNHSYGERYTWRDYAMTAIVQKYKGYQVIRYFIIDASIRSCWEFRQMVAEVAQRWIDKEGNITLLAKDYWNKEYGYWRGNTTSLRLRDNDAEEYQFPLYGIRVDSVQPFFFRDKEAIDKCLFANQKYLNYTDNSFGCAQVYFSPLGEWLQKCHKTLWSGIKEDTSLLNKIVSQERQFRIAMRGKFRFTKRNLSMWCDYAEMLENNLPNCAYQQFYLCPKDLRHSHDWITRIDIRRREKEKTEMDRQRAISQMEKFMQSHAHLLNILFGNEHITLRSLNSPMEYVEEGKAMHHCVAGYVEHNNALILSARDSNGNRIATIEVSINNLDIVQVRGVCNKYVEEDAEIRSLIKKNLPKIIQERNQEQLRKVA